MLALGLTALLVHATPATAAPGNGFGTAGLVGGTPDFTSCINGGGDCQENFYRFLSESMLEQGFAMQDHPVIWSPLTHRRQGWSVGGSVATFPFGPPPENLSGKEENTQFSPVFPRIAVGFTDADGASQQRGLGFSFTPPVPVGGASALALTAGGSLSKGARESVRHAVEADVSYIRAKAPVVATEDQVADRDAWSNPDNLDPATFNDVCGEDVDAGAGGCLDTFTLLNASVRVGQAWWVGPGFTPYVKAGVTAVNEWMYVKYDDTTWRLFAIQPTLHAGSGWNPGEHVFLQLGVSAALRQANQSESGSLGVFTTFEGAAAWRF